MRPAQVFVSEMVKTDPLFAKLADSSKFGTITAVSVLPLSGARIVTDRLEDRRYLDHTDIKVV